MRALRVSPFTIILLFIAMCLIGGLWAFGADKVTKPSERYSPSVVLGNELPVIDAACDRNDCNGQLRLIVYAIRIAENGASAPRHIEFGIMNDQADTFDKQAGWAAATVTKNYARWVSDSRPGEFIDYLSNKYCPKNSDLAGNVNWQRNVNLWYDHFGGNHNFNID